MRVKWLLSRTAVLLAPVVSTFADEPGFTEVEEVAEDSPKALPEKKPSLIVATSVGPTWNSWMEAVVTAKKRGYTNIKGMRAGISGWIEAGAKVEKSDVKPE